jgi:hypothetical protein
MLLNLPPSFHGSLPLAPGCRLSRTAPPRDTVGARALPLLDLAHVDGASLCVPTRHIHTYRTGGSYGKPLACSPAAPGTRHGRCARLCMDALRPLGASRLCRRQGTASPQAQAHASNACARDPGRQALTVSAVATLTPLALVCCRVLDPRRLRCAGAVRTRGPGSRTVRPVRHERGSYGHTPHAACRIHAPPPRVCAALGCVRPAWVASPLGPRVAASPLGGRAVLQPPRGCLPARC